MALDQKLILKSILTNQDYARSVLSHLDATMFEGAESRFFTAVKDFFVENAILPNEDVALHLITEIPKAKKEEVEHLQTLVHDSYEKPLDPRVVPYLIEQTEKWGLEKSVYNAIVFGIGELEQSNQNFGEVYNRIRAAVSYAFSNSIGQSYFGDAEARWEQYNDRANKFSFGLDELDKNSDGGYEKGTLNIFAAASNGGKSIALVNVAAAAMLRGENVLYITMEMAEKKIAERVDAKILSIPVWAVTKKTKEEYVGMVSRIQSKTTGELIVKQYPTSSASVLDFRNLLEELRLKRGFNVDLLIVDYLGICADARGSGKDNTYIKLKNISEDLRGLAIEYQIPVFSAAQLNRGGYGNSSAGMDNMADSMSLNHTADWICSIYRNEELIESNKAVLTVLKNRYGPNDVSVVVGADFERMSFFNIENQSYDNSQTGRNTQAMSTRTEELVSRSGAKKDTSGFKFG
jgi:replicative DNA helicase